MKVGLRSWNGRGGMWSDFKRCAERGLGIAYTTGADTRSSSLRTTATHSTYASDDWLGAGGAQPNTMSASSRTMLGAPAMTSSSASAKSLAGP